MAQGHSRPAWAEIDLAAITHNARVLSQLVRPAQLCAVVKAHGYGHGAAAVARAALAGGAIGLAVALVDEGVELRQRGVRGPILLSERVRRRRRRRRHGLRPHAHAVHAPRASSCSRRRRRMLGQRNSVHVKVDTGMHRVGAPLADVPALLQAVADDPLLGVRRAVDPPGRWPTGRAPTTAPSRWRQLASFDGVLADLIAPRPCPTWCTPPTRPAPSPIPTARYNMVRCGIGLYGYLPGPAVAAAFAAGQRGRRSGPPSRCGPASSRCAPWTRASAPPTAGCARCPGARVVATVPLGYADGVPAGPVHQRLQRAHRRPPPPAGRHGDDGPDHGRLRRRHLGAPGRRGRAPGPPGRRGDHGGRVGRPPRHHQLRGPLRHRPAGAPGRGQRPRADGWLHVRPRCPEPWRHEHRRQTWERLRTDSARLHQVPAGRGPDPGRLRGGRPRGRASSSSARARATKRTWPASPSSGARASCLDRLMLEEIGITRAECYIANVVKCRPPQNRDPAPAEIEACRPYLEEQITLINPSVVVTLGNFATRLLLDRPEGIRQLRGDRPIPYRTGPPRADLPPGLRPARRRRGPGRNARRSGPGQAAPAPARPMTGWPVVVGPIRRGDQGGWRPAWPALCARAT